MADKQSGISKKSLLDMELSTFEIPPAGEALVLGKRSPIGPEAAKRMLDNAAPEEFDLIQPEDDVVQGIMVRTFMFLRADREALIKMILEEAKPVMTDRCMLRVKCDIRIAVRREI